MPAAMLGLRYNSELDRWTFPITKLPAWRQIPVRTIILSTVELYVDKKIRGYDRHGQVTLRPLTKGSQEGD